MAEEERFIDNGDGTITDVEKNIMWTKTDTMNDLKKWCCYQDCLDYVRHLRENNFAGYDDWRLPTRDQMGSLYGETLTNKDVYGKDIHISEKFEKGGGFSIVAEIVPGRARSCVLNIREGGFTDPDGLWTLSEASRGVRVITPKDK
jgi:hypothetical protein